MQNNWNVEVVVIEAKNLTDLRLLFALLLLVFVTSLGTPLMLAQRRVEPSREPVVQQPDHERLFSASGLDIGSLWSCANRDQGLVRDLLL